MKYFKDWNLFKTLKEALDLSNDAKNTLELIKKNSTLPLLNINTKNNSQYIKLVQDTLKTQGYDVDVNGIFDNKTKEAVINYQSSDGLTKDGIVGKNTWKSILSLNDINIEPKIITNNTVKQVTNTNKPTTTKPSVTNKTIVPVSKDYKFRNTKGEPVNYSTLVNASNKWYNDIRTVGKLIINNKANKQFILDFNKLYYEKTHRTLLNFMMDVYSKSLLGGRKFEIAVNLFEVLLTYFVSPETDAKIFNWCIKGLGTEDKLINTIFDKRANMPEDYKKKILVAYEKNYGVSFSEDMVDDGIDEELIKKIDTNYFSTEE